MTSLPDTRTTLIRRLADPNDGIAWAEFEQSYQPAVYRYLRFHGLQQSDAMDAMQEIMLALHKRAASWQPSGRAGSFRAWLIETARRIALQQIRQCQRAGLGGTEILKRLNEVAGPATQDDANDEQRWMFYCAAAIVEAKVEADHWRAFWMTAVESRSADQVARELDMKLGTVYSIRCRVLAKIRSEIETMLNIQRGES